MVFATSPARSSTASPSLSSPGTACRSPAASSDGCRYCASVLPRGGALPVSAAGRRAHRPRAQLLTLDHPTAEWRRVEDRHRLSFADVWASDAYLDNCLPTDRGTRARLHRPRRPLLLPVSRYFFAVDMRTKKAVVSRHHHGVSNSDVPSSSLLPWVLPPALLRPAASPPGAAA
ncbi:hypothetical protein BS78_02G233700 [Paspalum vaginatum]|nr:hypothetical protein BS78_02G233700 [Paspalum vaginatum]